MRLRTTCAVVGLLCSLSALADTAVTNRETELKKEHFSDAATITVLPKNTSVEVLKRESGWTEVKPANAGSGWVRMLNLSFGEGGGKDSGGGLGALFNVARTGSTGATQTTGVKGLDKESIENANPNMAELRRMHGFGASSAEALKFASAAGLHKQAADYLPAGSANSSGSKSSTTWGDN